MSWLWGLYLLIFIPFLVHAVVIHRSLRRGDRVLREWGQAIARLDWPEAALCEQKVERIRLQRQPWMRRQSVLVIALALNALVIVLTSTIPLFA